MITASGRPKPRRVSVQDDLAGLLVVKLGRKSTPDRRNPGKSVDDQLGAVDKQCDRLGLVELARFEEDQQGASKWSKSTERAKFEEAMRLISTHPVAVFAVWSLSRSSRRLMVHGRMVELLEERNCLIMVEGRLYDCADPQDQLTLGFTALMDQNQVAVGRLDTLRGLAASAQAGRPHGPNVYGYRRIYDERTRALLRVEVVPEEAAVIVEIAERVINRESLHSIARLLTERGVPRPRGAKAWYPQECKDLVTKITYVGQRSHTLFRTDITETWPAIWDGILTQEEFESCAAALAARSRSAGWSKSAKYLLTGLIWCSRCQGQMFANRQGGLRRRPPDGMPMVYDCRACRLSRDMKRVDETVLDAVARWFSNPETVNRHAAASAIEDPQLQQDRLALARAEQELEEAYEAGLSPRGLVSQEKRLLPLIEELKQRLVAIPSGDNGWISVANGDLKPEIPSDVDEARRFLARFIRVTILPAGRGARFNPDRVVVDPIGRRS